MISTWLLAEALIKQPIQPIKKEGKMSLFNAKEYKLKNGLRVILIKQLSQAVSVSVLYHVGTADDPSQHVGLSHFLEHMMFRGTKKYPGNLFKEKVVNMGGYINAFTSFDLTCYENRVPLEALDEILDMEADRMVNLEYKQKDIDAELKAVEEEYGMRIGNSSTGPVTELIYRNLYLYHPYGVLPIGYPHHIKSYTRKNAFDWYKKWYHPNNAVLIVAGDIDFDATLEKVKKHFDALSPTDIPQRNRLAEPALKDTTRYIKQENDRFAYSMVEFIYEAPSKSWVYDLAIYLLGGDSLSLFYNHFVRKLNNGIQDVHVGYSFSLDDPNTSTVIFKVSPEKALQSTVFDTYESYKKELLSGYLNSSAFKDLFENAKKRLISNLIHQTDGTTQANHAFINLGFNMTFDEIMDQESLINNITLEDVKKAISDILTQKPKLVFVGVPKTTNKPEKYSFRVD